MTDAQKRFCDEYLIDLNATRAYKVAYPNCKKNDSARKAGSRLLTNVDIQNYVEEKIKEREKRTEVTQDMVIKELSAIAFSKASDYAKLKKMKRNIPILDEEGMIVDYKEEEYTGIEFTPTDELSEEQKKALSGIKQGKFGLEVNSCDKVRALELLGRHLGIFNDKLDVNVKEKEEKKNAISDILNQMQNVDDV